MSRIDRLICCLLSISLGLPATPTLYAAQGKLQPRTTPAKSAPQSAAAKQAPQSGSNARRAAQPAAKGAAKSPAQRPAQPATALTKTIDLTYVQPDAFAVAVLHPRALLTAPEMELFPREVVTAAAMKEAGIDPAKIDRVIISLADFNPPREPKVAIAAYFSEPLGPDAFAPLKASGKKVTLAGQQVLVQQRDMALHFPNDRTVVATTGGAMEKLLAGNPNADSPLFRRLKETDFSAHAVAVVSLDAIREPLDALLAQAPPLPPQFQQFLEIPDLTSAIEARAQLGGSPDLEWTFHARNEQSAMKLERLINDGVAMARQMFLTQLAPRVQSDDPVEQAAAQYMRRVVDHIAGLVKPTRQGDQVTIAIDTDGGVATSGVLVALLLPAIQAAREAARRTASMNNMKQIALAMHNYHDVYKSFPARAIKDKPGKPLLSWRVQVLPYIEENDLYQQFHLDEPWDSEHNKKLLAQMPAVYRNPNLPDGTKTNYLVPVGEDTIFSGDEPARIADITDGTSKTIMLLEVDADRAVPWTKPDDYEVDADKPLAGLGNLRGGGIFLSGFADGSVRAISRAIDPETFLLMLKKADGQAIQIP